MKKTVLIRTLVILFLIVAALFAVAAVVLLFRIALIAAAICALFAYIFYSAACDIDSYGNGNPPDTPDSE